MPVMSVRLTRMEMSRVREQALLAGYPNVSAAVRVALGLGPSKENEGADEDMIGDADDVLRMLYRIDEKLSRILPAKARGVISVTGLEPAIVEGEASEQRHELPAGFAR